MEDKHLTLKHRFFFGATVSLFFTMSLLIYGPLKVYVTANEDLWFSFYSLIIPVAVVSICGFVACTAITSLPKGSIHKLLCCLLFGISLGLYIQGGFFNISYGSGVLDGSEIAWRDYTTYGAIDSAMWAACLALPFAFFMVFKRQWRHILMVAAASIMVFQVAGLALTLYQNQASLSKLSHEVTKEGIYELSEKDNTLVFVLSSMDQKYYDEYKSKNKEYKVRLEGFTEYNNALASGAGSMVSFPAMMTGTVYKKDIHYSDYIDHIWREKNVFTLLDQEKVDARIYCDDMYFGDSSTNLVKNVVNRAQDPRTYPTITKTIYKYTLYHFAPHYLKRFFWMNTSEFSAYKSNTTYTQNDANFFKEYADQEGFEYTDDYDGAVRVYYLKGAQSPYRLTADGKNNLQGTSREEQVEGEFNAIFGMIDDLKQNGRFNSATIIITADNGDTGLAQHPLLLVKPRDASGEYTVSDAPVTLFDLPSTIASTVSERYYSYGSGMTFSDVEGTTAARTRYFYLNAGSNADSRIEEYKLNGPIGNGTEMELMNNFYVNGGKVDKYILGTELKFTTDETAAIYCSEGFGHTNGLRTLLRGPHGQMVIPIDSLPENAQDLHVYFNVLSVYEDTPCIIKANGKTVFNRDLDSSVKENGLNFRVHRSDIKGNNVLTLDFYFPEIDNSELELDANRRSAVVSFTSFKIYTQ